MHGCILKRYDSGLRAMIRASCDSLARLYPIRCEQGYTRAVIRASYDCLEILHVMCEKRYTRVMVRASCDARGL